jgi:hypothetical protein
MTIKDAIDTLTQRRNWLRERVEAKKRVGWDVEWDEKERDALTTIIDARIIG